MAAVVLDSPWTGTSFTPPTPLDIATIETAIIRQLQSQITSIEIAHYPDSPETYRMTHRIGAALVRYEGAKYGRLLDAADIVQEKRLEFAIELMMRDLGWGLGGSTDGTSPGAYAMLESIRVGLTGFQPSGCSKVFPISERFVERDKQGGVWVYQMLFGLTTAAVEQITPPNFPLFVLGRVQEQGGQTTLSVAATPYTFMVDDQIQLPFGNLIQLEVSNPTNGILYVSGTDYTVDTVAGTVSRVATGTIQADATVMVAYSYAEVVEVVAGGRTAPTNPTN